MSIRAGFTVVATEAVLPVRLRTGGDASLDLVASGQWGCGCALVPDKEGEQVEGSRSWSQSVGFCAGHRVLEK